MFLISSVSKLFGNSSKTNLFLVQRLPLFLQATHPRTLPNKQLNEAPLYGRSSVYPDPMFF